MDQRCLAGVIQVVAISMIVGIRTISIVEGLGFGGDQFREFV